MGLKTEIREINGTRYAVTQLGSDQGLRLFFKLGKLVGPSIAALLRQWRGGELQADTLAAGLTELAQQLAWDDFQDFVATFRGATSVLNTDDHGNEKRTPLETLKAVAFAGDYGGLVRWLGFCMEVNYSNFFAGLGLTSPRDSSTAA